MSKKRVFIGVGHGGKDPGAVGYVREADANLTIALELKRLLEAEGYTVGISRTRNENDPLAEEIKEANAFKPDLAIDVHNNAGKGDGFEVLVQTGAHAPESRRAGQAIEKRVKAIGQNSRGVKTRTNGSGRDYFGFLREIKAPAVIVEGFFVDNATDAAAFDTAAEQRKLAQAYARGIIDHLGGAGPLYRVQVGAFSKKAHAERKLAAVKAEGFTDAYIACVDGKLWRVQIGAFSKKANAEKRLAQANAAGFSGYVTAVR